MINNRGEVLFQASIMNDDLEYNGALVVATVHRQDACTDGLDPNGEYLTDRGFDAGDIFLAWLFGWLCEGAPSDVFMAEVRPDPFVTDGQTLTAVAEFDPALGDITVELFTCGAEGCIQPLTPTDRLDIPGLQGVRWKNDTGETQLVAIKTTRASGGPLPYLFRYWVDLPSP